MLNQELVDALFKREQEGPEIIEPFVDMSKVISKGILGEAKVIHRHIEVLESLRSLVKDGSLFYSPPGGPYVVLTVGDTLMMSNTLMEQKTNREFIQRAKGTVLIGGLGIGLCIPPLLNKRFVQKIVVIEKSVDVINLILPQLKSAFDCSKLEVVEGDIYNWKSDQKFDTIWMDIWSTSLFDRREIQKVKDWYRPMLKYKSSWIGCWIENFKGVG